MDKIYAGIKELKSTGEFDKIDLSQLDWIVDELEIVKREDYGITGEMDVLDCIFK